MNFNRKIIYMDHASSTPTDKTVLRVMRKAHSFYANPSSIHKLGVYCAKEILNARKKIASYFSLHANEIIFTGSATESNMLSIHGAVYGYEGEGIPHIITTKIEHKSVLENFQILNNRGLAEVTYLDVNEKGILELETFKKSLKKNTIFISIGYANNEIGTIQDIQEFAREIRRHKKNNFFINKNYPYFHTDATQATNYLFTKNMEKIGVDMMTLNGAKIYGPKGIGLLCKKQNVKLSPVYGGGGQEFGLRPGTENLESILGIAHAIELAQNKKEKESIRLEKLKDLFIDELKKLNKDSKFQIKINGDEKKRLPNNVNISISNISNELVLLELDAKGVMASTKSACGANDEDVSHVISAIRKTGTLQNPNQISHTSSSLQGLKYGSKSTSNSYDYSLDSLRFSFGRDTKEKDIFYTINILKKIFIKYKNML